jgi:hypothetical protein
MKHLIRIGKAAIVLAILGAVSPLYACTCVENTVELSPAEARAALRGWFDSFEGALFIGRVTALEAVESEFAGVRVTEMKVTFSVERYWKGVDGRTITIFTGAGCCDCGVSYSVGERYFILAQRVDARLRTDICTSPKGLDDVKPYEMEFGRGMVPNRPK